MLVASRVSQEAVAPSAGGKAKILLVDDRRANLLALRAVLEDLGPVLVEARSGEEVLSLVLQDDFAAILLDIQMPGLNGFELARLLRSRKRSRHTPIIFLTAYDRDDFPPAQAYSLGAVDYLVTPLAPVVLRAKVAVFVDLFEKTEQVKRQAEALREAERGDFERRLAEQAVRESQARLTLAAIVESSEDAIIGKAMDGTITSWNRGAEHLYGYAAEEVEGKSISLLIPPDSPDELPGIMERLRRGEYIQHHETVRVRKDGRRLDVSVTISPIRGATGRTVGASSIARDITERIRRERRLVAEHAVSQILAASSTLCDAAPRILQAVCDGLGWDAGTVWAVDRGANELRCVQAWHRPGMEAASFEEATRQIFLAPGVGMPGRVWADQSLVWLPDVTADANCPCAPIAARAGLHGAVGFPIRNGAEFLGVMGFFSREVREPDEALVQMMASIGSHISQFIERRRAESELRRQQEGRRIARRIQEGFLPKNTPSLPGFRVGGKSLPAVDVGGDCFDFIPLVGGDPESLGVLIADVSGHGIGAAVIMAQTRAYLRGLTRARTDVGTLLTLTNRRLAEEMVPDQFVTLFFLRLDLHNRLLRYSGAGHWPGYVLDRQGRTRAVLASTGVPLGVDPGSVYPESPAVPLERGELVLLFTDGLVEAASPGGNLFGLGRVLAVVRAHQQETPEDILEALFGAVTAFSAQPLQDDITAVILKAEDVG